MSFVSEYPSIHVVEYVRANKLKRDHTSRGAPLQVVLEEPHARVAYNEPALPPEIVLKVSLH